MIIFKFFYIIFLTFSMILQVDSGMISFLHDLFTRSNATDEGEGVDIIINRMKRAAEAGMNLPDCSDDQMMVYLAEIQAINPESIVNLATIDELDVMCKQISDSLDKIDEFLESCKIPPGKDLYVQLIKGVDKMYNILCQPKSSYRKDFQGHFACLRELHEDFDTCFGPPDWTENGYAKEVCRVYKDIGDCYYIKAARVCGNSAARTIRRIVASIMDSILTIQCSMGIYPMVADEMPEKSQGRRSLPIVLMVLAALIAPYGMYE